MTASRQRVALVTGASSGIGAAITDRLVAEDIRVVACARREDRLRALADRHGAMVLPRRVDVRRRADVGTVIRDLPGDFADIDILVNNAGVALGLDPLHRAEPAHAEEMVATNCLGLLHCTQAVLGRMVQRGGGHVINVGSVAGNYAYPAGNVYGATKAFVQQLSRNLRSDLHGTNVRVTCIDAGTVGGTEFSRVRFDGDLERAGAVYAGLSALTPDDIAAGVLWALGQPAHVNVNSIEIMPVAQSVAGFQFVRTG